MEDLRNTVALQKQELLAPKKEHNFEILFKKKTYNLPFEEADITTASLSKEILKLLYSNDLNFYLSRGNMFIYDRAWKLIRISKDYESPEDEGVAK